MPHQYTITKKQTGLEYALNTIRLHGPKRLATRSVHALQYHTIATLNKIFPQKRQSTFTLNQQIFEYYDDRKYNDCWMNERRVEIALGDKFINHYADMRILTVGAVMKHYRPTQWDILDKFEAGEGIINQDILEYKPKQKFDAILSISTLEHIGYDDDDVNPNKILQTVDHLKKYCLKKNGVLLATIPIGYNPWMDQHIENKSLKFENFYYLKRTSLFNTWKQVDYQQVKGTRYNWPYNNSNALVIATIGHPLNL